MKFQAEYFTFEYLKTPWFSIHMTKPFSKNCFIFEFKVPKQILFYLLKPHAKNVCSIILSRPPTTRTGERLLARARVNFHAVSSPTKNERTKKVCREKRERKKFSCLPDTEAPGSHLSNQKERNIQIKKKLSNKI